MNKILGLSIFTAFFFTGLATAQPEAMVRASQKGVFSAATPDVGVLLELGPEIDGAHTATIRVLENGVLVHETERTDLFSLFYGPIVQIVEMDPDNNVPEIYISTYSGGAHCCNVVEVMTKKDAGWQQVEFGAFDGDPEALYPRDLNGDGQSEIETFDNRFLYTFASYAGSSAPIMILGFKNGEVANLTTQSDFEWIVRAGLEGMGTIPDTGEPRNSWLATHAAYLLILGEENPLDYAINAHDSSVDWGMIRCKVPEVDFSCPEGQSRNIGFEDALSEFLTETGYLR